jgi:hypothetical protein
MAALCKLCGDNPPDYDKKSNKRFHGWCRRCHKRYRFLIEQLKELGAYAAIKNKVMTVFKAMMKVSGDDERRTSDLGQSHDARQRIYSVRFLKRFTTLAVPTACFPHCLPRLQ